LRIGLIDVDSKIPNLALMKLSAYHKRMGDEIVFPYKGGRVDRLYASVVFERSRPQAELLARIYPSVEIGGTGWDVTKTLPPEIESGPADYGLYGIDYGLGFVWRGCVNRCKFCFVPRKEGAMHQVAGVADLINPKSNRITFLDNNFTAAPNALDIMAEIVDRKLSVDWCQGLDIRRMTPEFAAALAKVDICTTSHRIHFAFDDVGLEWAVRSGVAMLEDAGIKPYRLIFYVLVGYNSTFAQDMYRFRVLRELGCDPFVMVYNKKGDRRLRHFARWVNKRIYKACAWDDYRPWRALRNQVGLDFTA
jgi:hypothetical protein